MYLGSDYKLMSLDELKKIYFKNKHLPDVPCRHLKWMKMAIALEMQSKLMRTTEELTACLGSKRATGKAKQRQFSFNERK